MEDSCKNCVWTRLTPGLRVDPRCGTGNYIEALQGAVSTVHGLEFNDGMFAQASSPLAVA